MNLTDFGVAVRKARLDAKMTLNSMATELGVSPAFLSSLEVGRKKIPTEWAERIEALFKERKVDVPNLKKLADLANRTIPLDGMNPQKAMMLAGFARTNLTRQQMDKFSKLMIEIEGD